MVPIHLNSSLYRINSYLHFYVLISRNNGRGH